MLLDYSYQSPLPDIPFQGLQRGESRVLPWEDVGEAEGTGIVHIAPGCGAEDFELYKRFEGLGYIVPTDQSAHFLPGAGHSPNCTRWMMSKSFLKRCANVTGFIAFSVTSTPIRIAGAATTELDFLLGKRMVHSRRCRRKASARKASPRRARSRMDSRIRGQAHGRLAL